MSNKLNNLTIFKRNASNSNNITAQINKALADKQSAINTKIANHNFCPHDQINNFDFFILFF